MKPTITSGKQVALMADISGSVFRDVNLYGAEFENVNMSQSRMHDINLSDISISAANLGGAAPIPAAPGGKSQRLWTPTGLDRLVDVWSVLTTAGWKGEARRARRPTIWS